MNTIPKALVYLHKAAPYLLFISFCGFGWLCSRTNTSRNPAFVRVQDRFGLIWVVRRDSLQQIRPGLIDTNVFCVYLHGTEMPIQIARTNQASVEKLFGL